MLTYTQDGRPADRATAVYEARVAKCGPRRGEDRNCNPSEALIQASFGGREAQAAVLRGEQAQSDKKSKRA
jgi:hypothetical protein